MVHRAAARRDSVEQERLWNAKLTVLLAQPRERLVVCPNIILNSNGSHDTGKGEGNGQGTCLSDVRDRIGQISVFHCHDAPHKEDGCLAKCKDGDVLVQLKEVQRCIVLVHEEQPKPYTQSSPR
jgi:hypothetical protein